MRFQPLEKLINLHDGYRRRIKIDELDVLLLQHENQVHILQSRCPHQEYSLEAADIDQGQIVCPIHRYRFDLESGRPVNTRGCAALNLWQPVFEGNEVGILLG